MRKHIWIVLSVILFSWLALLACSSNQLVQATLSPEPAITSPVVIQSLMPRVNPTLLPTTVSGNIVLKNDLRFLPAGKYVACYSHSSDLNITNFDVFNIDSGEKYPGLVLENLSGGEISSNEKLITDLDGNLYIIDIVSGDVNKFLLPPDSHAYRYSPIKNQLVAVGAKSIFILSLLENTWEEIEIIKDDVPDLNELGNISWSPNGKWLAFTIDAYKGLESGKEGLYVIETSCFTTSNSCSMQMTRIAKVLANILTWTPEDNLAIVDWSQNNGSVIDVYDVQSAKKIKSYEANPSDGTIFVVAWSPDSDWIAIQQDYTEETTLLSLDGEPQKIIQGCDGSAFWIIVR